MRILVIGAGGMLSSDLVPFLGASHDCTGTPITETDITSRDSLEKALSSYRPEVVVNCAAYTQVDAAETERDTAMMINGIGVQNLAMTCKEHRVSLCHISTDYVFDGKKATAYTPYDLTNPINYYGETKLAGEKYLEWVGGRYFIIRTSWLYGAFGPNFVKTIQKLAQERDELRVVNDQKGNPTWTVNLCRGIQHIIESNRPGIYHVTDQTDGTLSWYGFARAIVARSGGKTRVVPVTTAEFPRPAARPANSVLDITATTLATGFQSYHWEESLDRFLAGS